MKQLERTPLLFAIALLATSTMVSSTSLAYPLSPWGAKLDNQTFNVTPYLYGYPGSRSIYPVVYLGYGISDRFDVYVGGAADIGLDPSYVSPGELELFPRYFFNDSWAVSLHAYWLPQVQVAAALEVHYNHFWDSLALTVNAGYAPTFDADGNISAGSVFAYIAPEYYITERFSVFAEVNPTFDLEDGLSVNLVPGVGIALDPEEVHTIALGLELPVQPFALEAMAIAAWYSTSFGGE